MSTKTLKQVLSNPRMFILPTKEQAKAKETLAKATITSSSGVSDAYYDMGTNTWHKLGAQVMPKKSTKEMVEEGSAIIDGIRKRKEEELKRIRALPSAKDLIAKDIVDTNEYFVLSQAIQADSSHGNYGVVFHHSLHISEALAKEMLSQGYKIGRWASIEKHGTSGLYISWEGDADIVLCQEDIEVRMLHSLDTYPNRDKWNMGGIDLNNSPF